MVAQEREETVKVGLAKIYMKHFDSSGQGGDPTQARDGPSLRFLTVAETVTGGACVL